MTDQNSLPESESLRAIFVALAEGLLATSHHLGGRIISQYIAWELTDVARKKDWAIKFQSHSVTENLPPGDPQACADIYKEMLNIAVGRIGQAVGKRPVIAALEQVFAHMNAESMEISQKYSFTSLLSQLY
jgi:hypothetical protein